MHVKQDFHPFWKEEEFESVPRIMGCSPAAASRGYFIANSLQQNTLKIDPIQESNARTSLKTHFTLPESSSHHLRP